MKKRKIINIEYGRWYFFIWFSKQVRHLKKMPSKRKGKEVGE